MERLCTERQKRAHMGQRAGVGEDMAAQAAASQAKHCVSSLQASDALSSSHNHAGTVAAGCTGVARVHAQHIEHIPAHGWTAQQKLYGHRAWHSKCWHATHIFAKHIPPLT